MGALIDILGAGGVHLVEKRHLLPVNPKQPWLYRELHDVKGAIIHHIAGVAWATSERIHKMHQDFGWPGMAYTFYVHYDYGQPGLPVVTDFDHRLRDWGPQAGAGPHSVNPETFGVALGGNFVRVAPAPEMIAELVNLMHGLQVFFTREVGYSLFIKPHFQVGKTKCPGLAWDSYLAAIGCA